MQLKPWTYLTAIAIIVAAIVYVIIADRERVQVRVSDVALDLLLADSFLERQRGLAGYALASLDADGMLFVFGDQEVRNFWMDGMTFAIDVVWVRDGRIVDIEHGIEPPLDGEDPDEMTSAPIPVDMAIELPAGKASYYGLFPGMPIELLP